MSNLIVRSPTQTIIPATLRVSGAIHAKKYGREGQRLPVRIDRSKRVWQRIWDHQQHNLILDSGIDYAMAAGAPCRFGLMHNFIAVGTGSVEPSIEQTALSNEIARTSGSLTFGAGNSSSVHVAEGLSRFMRRRAWDFGAANGNLTEFGATEGSATLMRTRDLFRDEQDNPVTITKTPEEQLVMEYTFFIGCSPTAEEAGGSVYIDGVGTLTYTHAFSQRMLWYNDGRDAYYGVVWSSGNRTFGLYTANINMSYTSFQSLTTGTTTWEPYVDGTFYRDVSCLIPAGASDITVHGFGLAHNYANSTAAHKMKLDTPFVKDQDYRISVGGRYSIARV